MRFKPQFSAILQPAGNRKCTGNKTRSTYRKTSAQPSAATQIFVEPQRTAAWTA